MSKSNEPPVIIKRYDDDGHDGHHGGGWKVAYADFMTAMMAFFLLLWILAASDEEKLRGLADYFTPSLSEAGGRGQGLLDGTVMGADGVMSGTDGPKSDVQLPSFGQENPLAVFDSRLRETPPEVVVEYEMLPEGVKPRDALKNPGEQTDKLQPSEDLEGDPAAKAASPEEAVRQAAADAAEQAASEAQRELTFEGIEGDIRETVAQSPEISDMAANISFERTKEGLLVQIIDQENRSLFARGSAEVGQKTRKLISVVGQAVADLPQSLTITGHTDAVPYRGQSGYTNWELSADRANSTRRILSQAGVSTTRFRRISGLAATQPINPMDPTAPENRRISVLVEYPEIAPENAQGISFER